MASTCPSSAHALGTNPSPRRSTAWWWYEMAGGVGNPSRVLASRVPGAISMGCDAFIVGIGFLALGLEPIGGGPASATIAAPAPAVCALVDDFHKWGSWSPYEKLDPAMRKTYDGPASGNGAVYTWAGNAKAGAGNDVVRLSIGIEDAADIIADLEQALA